MFNKIKKTIGGNYTISRWYHELRLRRESKKIEDPIIVYQMGKVASTTIVDGLHYCKPEAPVYHVHFLSDTGTKDANDRLARLVSNFNANTWCLYESAFVRKQLDDLKEKRHINIVTLAREPISRNISSFFYNVHKYVPDFDKYRIDNDSDMESLKLHFLEHFPEHDYAIRWFDDELKQTFGIDVYASGFCPEKGYTIIDKGSVRVLLIKLEKLKECASSAFRDFMGLHDFQLMNSNTSDEQPYFDFYQKFLQVVELPEQYINKMYDSSYMKHLYSAEEIQRFRSRWMHE